MEIAIIYNSPYNKKYQRLHLLDVNKLPDYRVNLVTVQKFAGTVETGGLPYCEYLGEKYYYNNGVYYHKNYMEREG